MASMNYCFTVCRAAEEKAHQEHISSAPIDAPNSPSTNAGAYFFGRFFSFGLSPPASTATILNPFIVKASDRNDINDNIL